MLEGNNRLAIQHTRHGLQLVPNELFSSLQLPIMLWLDGQGDHARTAFASLIDDYPNIHPRNTITSGWVRPITPLMRANIANRPPDHALVDNDAEAMASDADVLEFVFREFGWDESR